jgi:hypothetical protein
MPGMLFGLNVSTEARAGTDPVAAASKAEELGFDFVSASDHLHGGRPTYEPWTMLSWIAAATSRIRVATRVLAVPYRPPAVLAKMAETLDRLSGGRLILGLAAVRWTRSSAHSGWGCGPRGTRWMVWPRPSVSSGGSGLSPGSRAWLSLYNSTTTLAPKMAYCSSRRTHWNSSAGDRSRAGRRPGLRATNTGSRGGVAGCPLRWGAAAMTR